MTKEEQEKAAAREIAALRAMNDRYAKAGQAMLKMAKKIDETFEKCAKQLEGAYANVEYSSAPAPHDTNSETRTRDTVWPSSNAPRVRLMTGGPYGWHGAGAPYCAVAVVNVGGKEVCAEAHIVEIKMDADSAQAKSGAWRIESTPETEASMRVLAKSAYQHTKKRANEDEDDQIAAGWRTAMIKAVRNATMHLTSIKPGNTDEGQAGDTDEGQALAARIASVIVRNQHAAAPVPAET